MSSSDQSRLLAIVESWNLNASPEFRGFRCALCQNYMEVSWHHFLHEGGYRTPVHFCDACDADFKNGIAIEKESHPVNRTVFVPRFKDGAEIFLDAVLKTWDIHALPVRKEFVCDFCGEILPNAEGYHIWRNKKGTLIEYHFDRGCGDRVLSGTRKGIE